MTGSRARDAYEGIRELQGYLAAARYHAIRILNKTVWEQATWAHHQTSKQRPEDHDDSFSVSKHSTLNYIPMLTLLSRRPSLIRLNTAISETLSLDMPPITEDTSVQPVILVWRSPSTYGPYLQHQRKKPLLAALINMVIIFSVSLIFMIISLKLLLPPIDEADKQYVKIPKSFDDLKDLNKVLQIYKERNGFRVVGSFTIVYLFLQAFSLPGSMYLSILAGAMYGFKALFLVCAVSSPSFYW